MIDWILSKLGYVPKIDLDQLQDRVNELEAKLKTSQRNDMPRDPVTGRWVKK